MVNVFFQPPLDQFPQRGGVATHLNYLHKHLSQHVTLVDNPDDADILHVESSWPIPKTKTKKRCVYTCHGGFTPSIIPTVWWNLDKADAIISVAKWMADEFFLPQYFKKTVIIPNGVEIPSDNIPHFPFGEGYILYAKEWKWHFEDFEWLVDNKRDTYFLSTIWEKKDLPDNLDFIGLQTQGRMQSILKNAGALILTGSEVCPTMLLEAWSHKVPVIAKRIDGSKELMLKENAIVGGSLYNGRDELVPAVDFVLKNRERLGQQGYEEVQKYLWKDLVLRYLEVYQSLL